MNRVRWSVTVPEATDQALRGYLAETGVKRGDISHFVDKAVQLYLADLVIENVKIRNKQYNQDEILAAIDEAISAH